MKTRDPSVKTQEPSRSTSPRAEAPPQPSQSRLTAPESIFDAELAFPQFHVPYRWWEDEASMILWAFNTEDIKRVVRFRLYDSDDLPRNALQRRNTAVITGFLAFLLPADQSINVSQLAHHDQVEELLKLCRPNQSHSVPWSWFLGPPDSMDASTIASNINTESCRQFKAVSFEDWARYALGYPTSSVQWLLSQHEELYNAMVARLDRFPEEIKTYIEIEKCLRSSSPMAHHLLLQVLKERGAISNDDPRNSRKCIAELIVHPIQELFKSRLSGLSSTLKKLSVLAIRFKRMYHQNAEIDWNVPFHTRPAFLDDFFVSSQAGVLARTLTHRDERVFSSLTAQSFLVDTARLRSLTRSWQLLCTLIEECCMAHPDMAAFFKDCAIILYGQKNYHSTTAILNGLQKARTNVSDLILPSNNDREQGHQPTPIYVFHLLDSTDNYVLYRKTMREEPGLPFLLPHIVECQEMGEKAVAGIFPLSVL